MREYTPTYLVVGHVTYDLVPGGRRPGGTALYAALTARLLGERVAVVTSAGVDFDFRAFLPNIPVAVRPARSTTTFENLVGPTGRRQRLTARAANLRRDDIPLAWRNAAVAHLAPVTGEVPATLHRLLHSKLRGLTIQGWLRCHDLAGWVSPGERPGLTELLGKAEAVVVSAEDLGDNAEMIARYATMAQLLVVTRGAGGADVYQRGIAQHIPAFPVAATDTTGAGDVFAAAFFVALARGDDPLAAGRFANCAASFAVEQPGTAGIPTAAAIAARLSGRPFIGE